MHEQKLLALIDQIYGASLDSSQWSSISNLILQAIGGHNVNFVVEDLNPSKLAYVYCSALDQSAIEHYSRDIMNDDPVLEIFDATPTGTAMLSQHFWGQDRLSKIRSYQEFYSRHRMTYFATGQFYKTLDRRAYLSIARAANDTLFTKESKIALQRLLTHLKRSMFINQQLLDYDARVHELEYGFNCIDAGVVMFNHFGKILFSNDAASELLDKRPQSQTTYPIKLPSHKLTLKVHKVIDAILHRSAYSEGCSIPYFEKAERKTLVFLPWSPRYNHQNWVGDNACCILFCLGSSTKAQPVLALHYDLTNKEYNVLRLLMTGKNVQEISEALFVSKATVRFHLKNLMRKTSTCSQHQLVACAFSTARIAHIL